MTDVALLGEFEQLVLLGVLRCADDAYGVPICAEIEARTGRDVSLGAVYKTLDRLEGKRLVRSAVGEATAERGGRRKRLYQVTPAGLKALRHALAGIASMTDGLDAVLDQS
jgi:PadR family transcriptional regulator, regulatory protein PadR